MTANAILNKITLSPDQLTSLIYLVRKLPAHKCSVLLAIFQYLQEGSLKSTATRKQIKEFTGLGYKTIYTHIKEFERIGLLKQWRGPFDIKQKFYRVNVPVPRVVLDFYGADTELLFLRAGEKKPASDRTADATQHTESVAEKIKESAMQDEFSSLEDSQQNILFQDAGDDSPDTPPTLSWGALPNVELANNCSECNDSPSEDSSQVAFSHSVGAHDNDSMDTDYPNGDDDAESYFADPRLALLVDQVERGKKCGTRLFKWLQSEGLLLYWPPTDDFRVDQQLLSGKIRTLDELTAILTGPVRPEHQWFVDEFLQICADNAYQAKDSSNIYAFEINMRLDEMLNRSNQGRPMWTVESIKVQLKMIIAQWTQLQSWPQLRVSIDQPAEPTLKFFIKNPGVWEAARARCIDDQEAKMWKLFSWDDEQTAATR